MVICEHTIFYHALETCNCHWIFVVFLCVFVGIPQEKKVSIIVNGLSVGSIDVGQGDCSSLVWAVTQTMKKRNVVTPVFKDAKV